MKKRSQIILILVIVGVGFYLYYIFPIALIALFPGPKPNKVVTSIELETPSDAQPTGRQSPSSPTEGTVTSTVNQIPTKAKPIGVKTRYLLDQVKNPSIVGEIDRALAINSDFQILKQHFIGKGYPFSPSSTNYITATDADGSPLVGFSYRTSSNDKTSSALIVSFYDLRDLGPKTVDQTEPKYTYMEILDLGDFSITKIWVDGKNLYSVREEFKP